MAAVCACEVTCASVPDKPVLGKWLGFALLRTLLPEALTGQCYVLKSSFLFCSFTGTANEQQESDSLQIFKVLLLAIRCLLAGRTRRTPSSFWLQLLSNTKLLPSQYFSLHNQPDPATILSSTNPLAVLQYEVFPCQPYMDHLVIIH